MTALAEAVLTTLFSVFVFWVISLVGAYALGRSHGRMDEVFEQNEKNAKQYSPVLSARDMVSVWENGLNPPPPNAAARKAAREHIQRRDRFRT